MSLLLACEKIAFDGQVSDRTQGLQQQRMLLAQVQHQQVTRIQLSSAVVFMGRHQLQPSLKWMGAFWLSIAGKLSIF